MKHLIIIVLFMISSCVFSQNMETSLSYDNVGLFRRLKMEAFVDSIKVHFQNNTDCEIKTDKSEEWITESFYKEGKSVGLSVNYFPDDSSLLFLTYDLPEQNTSLSVFWHKNGAINTVGFSDLSTMTNPTATDSLEAKPTFCITTSYFSSYDMRDLSFCFKENSMNGLWLEYDDEGYLKSEKHFLHGRRAGKWKYYDDYGELSKQESYGGDSKE